MPQNFILLHLGQFFFFCMGFRRESWQVEFFSGGHFGQLCFLHDLAYYRKVAKEAKLKGFEQAKAIHLESEAFSLENGLLTATFKSKRPQLRDRYRNQIDALYSSLGATITTSNEKTV